MLFLIVSTLEIKEGKLVETVAIDATCNHLVVDRYEQFFVADHVLVSY